MRVLLLAICFGFGSLLLLANASSEEQPNPSDNIDQHIENQPSQQLGNNNNNNETQDELQLRLAEANLFGSLNSGGVDFATAMTLLKDLSDRGIATAHLYLGFMYSAGLGVEPSQPKALIYYTFAAACDNKLAKMILAYRYWSGLSVQQDCETSFKLYEQVAKEVIQDKEFRLSKKGRNLIQKIRLHDEYENPGSYGSVQVEDDIIQYYEFLAEKGDVQAQVFLGQLNFQDARQYEDHRKAMPYLEFAAASGNSYAMAYLGKIHSSPKVAEQNMDYAFNYFKLAAQKGNPLGLAGLGLMYLHGTGVAQSYEKALNYFNESSIKNSVDGHLQMGIMYYKGLGIDKDYEKAFNHLKMASRSGNIVAIYNLARMYAAGKGTTRDCPTATQLIKGVAERGNWADGFLQAYNDYRDSRIKVAFVTYAFLSELGFEVAQSNAAYILDKGELLTTFALNETQKRAIVYWKQSAAQGHVLAHLKLGDHYYYGHGTEVDHELAAIQYRTASDRLNNAQAHFNLGYMHETGLGLKKDIHLARRYYELAAAASEEAHVPVALVKMKMKILKIWNIISSHLPPFNKHDEWESM